MSNTVANKLAAWGHPVPVTFEVTLSVDERLTAHWALPVATLVPQFVLNDDMLLF